MGFRLPGQVQQIIRTELAEIAWNAQLVGEAVSVYDVVFRDGDYWKLADASVVANARPPLGIAQDTAASGGTADVWMRGLLSNGSWSFTSGNRVFLASGGGLTMSSPPSSGDTVIVMGWAVGIRAMELRPEVLVRLAQ